MNQQTDHDDDDLPTVELERQKSTHVGEPHNGQRVEGFTSERNENTEAASQNINGNPNRGAAENTLYNEQLVGIQESSDIPAAPVYSSSHQQNESIQSTDAKYEQERSQVGSSGYDSRSHGMSEEDKSEETNSQSHFIVEVDDRRALVQPYSSRTTSPIQRKHSDDVPLKSRQNRVHSAEHVHENTRRMSHLSVARVGDTAMGRTDEDIGCCGYVLMFLSLIVVVLTFPFSMFFTVKVVQEYERAVIFRLGRVVAGEPKGPGMFFMFPGIDEMQKVDLRTVSHDIPPQEILTKDSVTVAVDAVMYARIYDPNMSVCNVANAQGSTYLLAATTLRNILGTKDMSELLSQREEIANLMQEMLDGPTDSWGIKVERVEIKDVRLPYQLQRAMAAEAEASREARAKVLAAEGEQKAARALGEAADIIAQSPSALQLRYLQTLASIATEKQSTILFPLPMEFGAKQFTKM